MSSSKLSVLCVVLLSSLQSNGHDKPVANDIGSLDDAPIRSLTEKLLEGVRLIYSDQVTCTPRTEPHL